MQRTNGGDARFLRPIEAKTFQMTGLPSGSPYSNLVSPFCVLRWCHETTQGAYGRLSLRIHRSVCWNLDSESTILIKVRHRSAQAARLTTQIDDRSLRTHSAFRQNQAVFLLRHRRTMCNTSKCWKTLLCVFRLQPSITQYPPAARNNTIPTCHTRVSTSFEQHASETAFALSLS